MHIIILKDIINFNRIDDSFFSTVLYQFLEKMQQKEFVSTVITNNHRFKKTYL